MSIRKLALAVIMPFGSTRPTEIPVTRASRVMALAKG